MIRIAVGLAAIAFAAAGALGQDRPSVRLEPGLWKVLIRTNQGGKPLPDKTENRCYSAAEVDDPVKTFATLFTDHDCTRSHAIADKTLTFGATCTGPAPAGGTLAVKAEGSYVFEHARRFTSTLVTTFTMPNQPSTVVELSKEADYVGPCPN